MTIVERLQKIKLFFSEEIPAVKPELPVAQAAPLAPPAPVEVKQNEVTTTDGLVLSIDKIEVGGIVLKDSTPVEDNNYTLADGTSFRTANGVIESIVLATPVVPEMPVVDEEMKKQLATMQAKFSAVEKEKTTFEKTVTAKLEKQNETIKLLLGVIEDMGNQSSDKPEEDPKPVYSSENHRKVLEARGKL